MCLQILPAEFDDVGRVLRPSLDRKTERSGIAEALYMLAPHIPRALVMPVMELIVPNGVSDSGAECREFMRKAAVEVINQVASFFSRQGIHGSGILSAA